MPLSRAIYQAKHRRPLIVLGNYLSVETDTCVRLLIDLYRLTGPQLSRRIHDHTLATLQSSRDFRLPVAFASDFHRHALRSIVAVQQPHKAFDMV